MCEEEDDDEEEEGGGGEESWSSRTERSCAVGAGVEVMIVCGFFVLLKINVMLFDWLVVWIYLLDGM